MKGVLIFCYRDWLDPGAGAEEQYVRQVFSRIAAQGCLVAWVCRKHPWRFRREPRPPVEILDGIQVARLGSGMLYRWMSGMFIERIVKKTQLMGRFDAVVDCITRMPLPLAEFTDTPVIPLVFDLARKVRAVEEPPGPVIAATLHARKRLIASGVPEKFIVCSPFNGNSAGEADDSRVWDRTASLVLATIENLEPERHLAKANQH